MRSITFPSTLHGTIPAWCVLVISLLGTALGWYFTRAATVRDAHSRFEIQVNGVHLDLTERLRAHEQVLRSGASAFYSWPSVTRENWRHFVDNLRIFEHYPGIQGLGFVQVVSPAEMDAHLLKVRREGFPAYTIWPQSERSLYTSILYLEPFDWRNQRAFGFDMFTQPVRRDAMERARDTGRPSLSGMVNLVQETEEDIQAGFLLYLPVYLTPSPRTVEDRRRELVGYVYSPFRMGDFMRGLLGERNREVALEIFDGEMTSENARMYSSLSPDDLPTHGTESFVKIVSLHLNGHTWTLRFSALPSLGVDRVKPFIVLGAGVLVSGLIWGIAWALAKNRAKVAAANERLRMDIATREKVEAQLRQAQKMEAVGQLTGGVAHDFNNLLTVIIGSLDLSIEHACGNPQLALRISQALAAAEKGAALTHRLLAFSRQQALQPTQTDLNQLVAGMVDLLRRTLGEHVEIKTELEQGLWLALADKSQVESALLNLAINSRAAMQHGGKLTVETANACLDVEYATRHAEVNPGDYVMLAVSDTGTGMPPEVVERACEPFFTTKSVGEGTGLGLSMIYGFAKQSGGHLKIHSELGHGATVRLYLPRAKTIQEVNSPRTTRNNYPGGSETILVVEDDEAVRRLVVAQLRSLGYRALEATNGVSAVACLRSADTLDLLFTDIVMPGGMTGWRLAAEGRRLRPEMKVLFTSGYTQNSILPDGELMRDIHLLSKPYKWSDLACKVKDALGTV